MEKIETVTLKEQQEILKLFMESHKVLMEIILLINKPIMFFENKEKR